MKLYSYPSKKRGSSISDVFQSDLQPEKKMKPAAGSSSKGFVVSDAPWCVAAKSDDSKKMGLGQTPIPSAPIWGKRRSTAMVAAC